MSDQNPYQAPASDVRVSHAAPPGSLIKAVLAGVLIDQIGTLISQLLLGALLGVFLLARGHSPDSIAASAQDFFAPGGVLYIVQIVLGLSWSVLGAYVCIRIAKRHELRLTVVLMVICLVLSVITALAVPKALENAHFWEVLPPLVLTLLSILLGAWLGRRKNEKMMRAR